MTERERKRRASIKKQLQKEGILPPDKPRLNRKRFAKEAMADYRTLENYSDDIYIRQAIGMMVSDEMKQVSDEEMGVLRMLKLSAAIKRFHEELRRENRKTYSYGEFYEKVYAPIMGVPRIKQSTEKKTAS